MCPLPNDTAELTTLPNGRQHSGLPPCRPSWPHGDNVTISLEVFASEKRLDLLRQPLQSVITNAASYACGLKRTPQAAGLTVSQSKQVTALPATTSALSRRPVDDGGQPNIYMTTSDSETTLRTARSHPLINPEIHGIPQHCQTTSAEQRENRVLQSSHVQAPSLGSQLKIEPTKT